MNNVKYMLLDDSLYAYIDDAIYYIAEYKNGSWERTIPFPMITFKKRIELTEEEAIVITNGLKPDDLFNEIAKEIKWNNRIKTEREIVIEFFEELVHCYKRNYFLLKKDNPGFKYSAKELDEAYGGNLYEEINKYYEEYLKLKENIFNDLIISKIENDYIIEFRN